MADRNNSKAKYYCENCASEVAANARFCPKCGRFFSSVRCPKCGKLGTVRDFKNGCPQCHYAMTDEELYGSPAEKDAGSDGMKHFLSFKSKRAIKKAFAKHEQSTSDAPTWVFFFCIGALIVAFVLFFIQCQ